MLPPFDRTALLLDLDGTLIDFAPTPDSVIIPPDLPELLHRLKDRLDGALAIVTGRAIEVVDGFLGAGLPVAGEHGGAIRHTPGGPIERPDLAAAPADWYDRAQGLADRFPGSLLERKARGFALHFRRVPDAGPVFEAALREMLAGQDALRMLAGQMLWEIRPAGADKGSAVRALMSRAPFAGRLPVFVGDDVTDADGIAAANAMGGAGLWVDRSFGSPTGVRRWLETAAMSGAWGEVGR